MSKARLALGALALISIPLGLIFLFVAFLHRNPPPPRPALDVSSPADGGGETKEEELRATALEGQWHLQPSEDVFVGYRVEERLLDVLSANTAVGRTSELSGGFVIRDGSVIGAVIDANLTALRSDDPERDEALRTRGLETSRYPMARFLMTRAAPISDRLRLGEPIQLELEGDLDLHGVKRALTLQVDAVVRRNGDGLVIDVAGSVGIFLSDFGIEPPDVAGMLDVQDHGEIEFQLRFVAGPNAATGPR